MFSSPFCLHQGGGLEALTERFQPQQATPPLMMEQKPGMYPQPYSSASPTTNLPGAFPGMVRQKPSFGPMPVQVPPPRGAFPTNMAMQPRQTLNRPPTAPNQLRLQLQQRLQGQQQVILPRSTPQGCGCGDGGTLGRAGSPCIRVVKVSLAFSFPPLQLIHQNRQAILNQFAASSPVGINMRAGMQQQITPQVREGAAARGASRVNPQGLSVMNAKGKVSHLWRGARRAAVGWVFFCLALIPAAPPASGISRSLLIREGANVFNGEGPLGNRSHPLNTRISRESS